MICFLSECLRVKAWQRCLAGFKYRICPETPLAFNAYKELRHEVTEARLALSRTAVMKKASERLRAGVQPVTPTGENCLDLEVYNVTKAPMTIRGSKSFQVTVEDCFPVVEGIFGPFRVPLLRTPIILDKEYGRSWSSTRRVKGRNGRYLNQAVHTHRVKRAAWPSMELSDCEPLLGGFVGAGPYASADDVPWRFV